MILRSNVKGLLCTRRCPISRQSKLLSAQYLKNPREPYFLLVLNPRILYNLLIFIHFYSNGPLWYHLYVFKLFFFKITLSNFKDLYQPILREPEIKIGQMKDHTLFKIVIMPTKKNKWNVIKIFCTRTKE